jgi:DNA-binding transcriptional MerR regulator
VWWDGVVVHEGTVSSEQAAELSNDTFIAYRRDHGGMTALAVFQRLTDHGVDCFYDMKSIRAGDFEAIILDQIAARPYFLLVLTPGTLERCSEPGDWLTREVQHAFDTNRTIVPVHTSDFDFADFDRCLRPDLAARLRTRNAQELPVRWFDYAVRELADEFLVPVEVPAPDAHEQDPLAWELLLGAMVAPTVTSDQLAAGDSSEASAYLWRIVEQRYRELQRQDQEEERRAYVVDEEGFSGTRTAQIVGISYRQLDYWARTNLIRPSLVDVATGSGSRRYSYRDLLELKIVKKLIDSGIRLESVREVFAYLREHMNTDITTAHLVVSGSDVLLVDGDDLINVLQRGQGTINVLPLGGVKEELDEGIVAIHPRFQSEAPDVADRANAEGRVDNKADRDE